MPVSGILVVCRPDDLPEVQESIEDHGWAEVHHTTPDGRLVVTIEADTTDEAMDRLLLIQALPHIAMAEMAEHYMGDEEFARPTTDNPLLDNEYDDGSTDPTPDAAAADRNSRREYR